MVEGYSRSHPGLVFLGLHGVAGPRWLGGGQDRREARVWLEHATGGTLHTAHPRRSQDQLHIPHCTPRHRRARVGKLAFNAYINMYLHTHNYFLSHIAKNIALLQKKLHLCQTMF